MNEPSDCLQIAVNPKFGPGAKYGRALQPYWLPNPKIIHGHSATSLFECGENEPDEYQTRDGQNIEMFLIREDCLFLIKAKPVMREAIIKNPR
jgi:hypothetical protein